MICLISLYYFFWCTVLVHFLPSFVIFTVLNLSPYRLRRVFYTFHIPFYTFYVILNLVSLVPTDLNTSVFFSFCFHLLSQFFQCIFQSFITFLYTIFEPWIDCSNRSFYMFEFWAHFFYLLYEISDTFFVSWAWLWLYILLQKILANY